VKNMNKEKQWQEWINIKTQFDIENESEGQWNFRVSPHYHEPNECLSVDFEMCDKYENTTDVVAITGYVKWDGCCNWDGSGHFCDAKDALFVAEAFGLVYQHCKQFLTNCDY